MIVVIEGVDNVGKSTLAKALTDAIHWPVQPSEGPEKFPGEINQRIRKYNAHLDRVIFDRHPCVSQPIYAKFRRNTPVEPTLLEQFYLARPLLIYCRAPDGRELEGHIAKDHDTPEHMAAVTKNFYAIREAYERWAIERADIICHWGEAERAVLLVHSYITAAEGSS